LVAFLRRHLLRPLVALGLCLCLGLSGCSQATSGLSGNYVDDTVSVAQTLLTTIALPQDDPARQDAELQARQLINGYTALYRPRQDIHGLASFTTMQTAVNALAAHYAAPIAVVAGTTLGMLIADVPAVFVGDRLANQIPMRLGHSIAAAVFAVLGVLTLLGVGRQWGL